MTRPELNARQEAFARKLAEGASQRAAYLAAGYDGKGKTADEAASQLSRNFKVRCRVEALQEEAAYRATVTVESIAKELDIAFRLALENKQAAACVAASMGKAKLFGLVTDKNQIEMARVDKPAPLPTSILEMDEASWRAQFDPAYQAQ